MQFPIGLCFATGDPDGFSTLGAAAEFPGEAVVDLQRLAALTFERDHPVLPRLTPARGHSGLRAGNDVCDESRNDLLVARSQTRPLRSTEPTSQMKVTHNRIESWNTVNMLSGFVGVASEAGQRRRIPGNLHMG